MNNWDFFIAEYIRQFVNKRLEDMKVWFWLQRVLR